MKLKDLFEAETVTITYDGYEYKVPAPDGKESHEYHTDDKQDAIKVATKMYDTDAVFNIKIIAANPSGDPNNGEISD